MSNNKRVKQSQDVEAIIEQHVNKWIVDDLETHDFLCRVLGSLYTKNLQTIKNYQYTPCYKREFARNGSIYYERDDMVKEEDVQVTQERLEIAYIKRSMQVFHEYVFVRMDTPLQPCKEAKAEYYGAPLFGYVICLNEDKVVYAGNGNYIDRRSRKPVSASKFYKYLKRYRIAQWIQRQ